MTKWGELMTKQGESMTRVIHPWEWHEQPPSKNVILDPIKLYHGVFCVDI